MLANFSKSSAGGTDLEVLVCAVVTPEAAPSASTVLSGLVGLLLFRVPSPLFLNWAGFLFWASALEEPGWDPPLPLFGVVSPLSTLAACRFWPFFAEAAFATGYDSISVQRLPDSTQFLHDGASSSLLPREKLLADEVIV